MENETTQTHRCAGCQCGEERHNTAGCCGGEEHQPTTEQEVKPCAL